MSQLFDIADAVKAKIDTLSLGDGVSVSVMAVPELALSDIETMGVIIVPRARSHSALTRGPMVEKTIMIDVGVLMRVVDDDIDSCVDVVETIMGAFLKQRLTTYPKAYCESVGNDPVYVPAHLQTKNQFTSVIQLTLKVTET